MIEYAQDKEVGHHLLMTRALGLTALVVVAACGGQEKLADRPCPDVAALTLDAAVGAPETPDAAAMDLDAALAPDGTGNSADASAAIDAGGSMSESIESLRARVAALDMKPMKPGDDPIPKPVDIRGRLGDQSHRPAPKLFATKDVRLSYGLPAAVILHIVRQNSGRYRLCFEEGLRRDPKRLKQSVRTRFAMDAKGEVVFADPLASTADASTTLCIVHTFRGLSFPEPEGVPLVAVELTTAIVFPE